MTNLRAPRFIEFVRCSNIDARAEAGYCRGDLTALTELQAALFDVAQAKLGLRPRSSFVPHLTLAYREPAIPVTRLDHPITWPARELALVRSQQGRGRYSYIGRWPLR